MVVDKIRADVVVESGPLHYSPPEGALVEGERPIFLAARQVRVDSEEMEGRNEHIYLLFSLEAEDTQLEAADSQLEAEDSQLEADNLQLEGEDV